MLLAQEELDYLLAEHQQRGPIVSLLAPSVRAEFKGFSPFWIRQYRTQNLPNGNGPT
jgi:hypothetical protein